MHDFLTKTINPSANASFGNLRSLRFRVGSPPRDIKPAVTSKFFRPKSLNYEAGYALWPGLLRGIVPAYNATGSKHSLFDGSVSHQVRGYKNELMNLAENKFIEELGAVRVNALDMWRTRKESATMIGSTMFRIATAGLALKKGRWRQCCDILGIKKKRPKESSFPSQWLEYSYGWAPLYGDCYIIANDMLTVPASPLYGKARGAWHDVIRYDGGMISSVVDRYVKGLGTATAFVTIDEPVMASLSQYGVLNPFAVMWESVPFSFVVDWFIPIGDYINQFNVTSGLKLTDYNVTGTVIQSQVGTVTGSPRFYPGYQHVPCISKSVSKSRILKSVPEFHFPRITNPLDFHPTRIANAIALLTTVFLQRS